MLSKQHPDEILQNQCYTNIALIALHAKLDGHEFPYEIAYGAMSPCADDLFVRHCFLLDPATQTIIDPTIMTVPEIYRHDDSRYVITCLWPQDKFCRSVAKYTSAHFDAIPELKSDLDRMYTWMRQNKLILLD